MIWFTSDLHFGHNNIIRMCNRPFATVSEMNEALFRNFCSRVHKNDVTYFLGDIAFKMPVARVNDLLGRMPGRKVLIRGNHDKEYASGLFDEICVYKELTLDGRKYVLMHYPLAEWNGFYRGAVHLYGHQHNGPEYNKGMLNVGRLQYDVGVDANNYAPVSLQEITGFFSPLILPY